MPDGVLKVYFYHLQNADLDGTEIYTKSELLQRTARGLYANICSYSEYNLRSYVHDPMQSPLDGGLTH